MDAPPSRPGGRLYLYVLIAIALGVAVGWAKPEWGQALKPLGDGFVRLIKMLIAPIIFVTVTAGIAGMGDLKRVGRVGVKALVWFEAMTTLALLLGLLIVTVLKPGADIHANVAALDTSKLDKTLSAPRPHGVVEHLLAALPESFVGAFVQGEILQVLVLAILAGIALAGLGHTRAQPLLNALEQLGSGLFAIVGVVMRLAPIGAFGAMAYTIGTYGVGTLKNLLFLMLCFYSTALLFVVVVLGAALRALGLSIFKLIRYLKDELILVLGTSSSESALPTLMGKLEALGCKPQVVRLVVPTGYSFNLDGTCIYLTMAAMFVAQALDVPLSIGEQLSLLLILLLTSKGAAAVTGGGFITLAATLGSLGTIPVGGISLLLGVDRFMSEARALTNLVGNAVATVVVSRWEQALDLKRAKETLDHGAPLELPASEQSASHGT
ncbi:MAG: C4-dicarboxylate transporter DctA [Archangiaceae bacterium]|nr:C4-dicarboxylate transporter DctA [Archangiaceae bacterium]